MHQVNMFGNSFVVLFNIINAHGRTRVGRKCIYADAAESVPRLFEQSHPDTDQIQYKIINIKEL